VSPEGTRSRDGELLPLKRGALLLAREAARPLVCVTVIGGHQRMPRGSLVVRGGPLRVVFGHPLSVASASEDELRARVAEEFRETKARYALTAAE
jgi:1-acyl-sn-glycerol-3-phosphate acyltransferase